MTLLKEWPAHCRDAHAAAREMLNSVRGQIDDAELHCSATDLPCLRENDSDNVECLPAEALAWWLIADR
jgi:hypothetical protein